jgi:hypothetical protein
LVKKIQNRQRNDVPRSLERQVATERSVRDAYAKVLAELRPRERLIRREPGYELSPMRADMRTVDAANVLLEWEFKISAGHAALGQILTYVALARREKALRQIRGVIAAFEFSNELPFVIEQMNLGIELVVIPQWVRWGGRCPITEPYQSVEIPSLSIPSAR